MILAVVVWVASTEDNHHIRTFQPIAIVEALLHRTAAAAVDILELLLALLGIEIDRTGPAAEKDSLAAVQSKTVGASEGVA